MSTDVRVFLSDLEALNFQMSGSKLEQLNCVLSSFINGMLPMSAECLSSQESTK